MAILLNNAPPTEEGAKLNLTAEIEEKCKVVYKLDDEGGAAFAELWDPQKDYSDEYAILPVRSTFKKVTARIYPIGTKFANVEGSARDTRPSDIINWIDFFDDTGINIASCCAENGKYYQYDNTEESFGVCNTPFCGGHIMPPETDEGDLPTESGRVEKGSDVYLLPICNKHNIHNNKKGPGAGFYMKLSRATQAVVLKGYFVPIRLHAMIDNEKK